MGRSKQNISLKWLGAFYQDYDVESDFSSVLADAWTWLSQHRQNNRIY